MMREILTTAALLLLLAATPAHSGFQEAWTKRKQLDHDYALDRAAPHYQHPRHRRHARLVTALDRFMATWLGGGSDLRPFEAVTAFCRREAQRAQQDSPAATNAIAGMSDALGRACTWTDFNAALAHAIGATGGVAAADARETRRDEARPLDQAAILTEKWLVPTNAMKRSLPPEPDEPVSGEPAAETTCARVAARDLTRGRFLDEFVRQSVDLCIQWRWIRFKMN